MGSDYALEAVYVHGCTDDIHVGRNVTIKDSYISNATDNGILAQGCSCFTVANVIIQHNTILPVPNSNSAVLFQSSSGPIGNVVVDNNLMDYGAYTVYSRDGGFGAPTNVSFTGNRFGRHAVGGVKSFDGNVTWSNNVWDDTGQIIS
jgi:polygalacturonase